MSDRSTSARRATGRVGRRRQLVVTALLWLLWVTLWGSLSAPVLVGGLVVAVVVMLAFPPSPPAIPSKARLRPLLRLLHYVLMDLVLSSVAVAREALRRGGTSTSITEVRLRVGTDLIIAATAHLVSLTPGTLAVEVDPDQRQLSVHALPAHAGKDREHLRSQVHDIECLIVATFGSDADVRALAGGDHHVERRGHRAGDG